MGAMALKSEIHNKCGKEKVMNKNQKNVISRLADYIVSEGTEHTENGKWSNTYDELYYHFGAEVTDTNENGKLLREELQRRDEVNELIMTEDCIEVSYHLKYCEKCRQNPLEALSTLGCNIYDEHESEPEQLM